ncbi:MAG: hypothetical protein V4490_04950 [Pseudomonadota bacterium]
MDRADSGKVSFERYGANGFMEEPEWPFGEDADDSEDAFSKLMSVVVWAAYKASKSVSNYFCTNVPLAQDRTIVDTVPKGANDFLERVVDGVVVIGDEKKDSQEKMQAIRLPEAHGSNHRQRP